MALLEVREFMAGRYCVMLTCHRGVGHGQRVQDHSSAEFAEHHVRQTPCRHKGG
jgi:hypothetical protein